MLENLFQTMIELYRYLGIQVLLLENQKDLIEKIDYGFRKKIVENFSYESIAQAFYERLEKGVCYLFEDDLHLFYSLFPFQEDKAQLLHCHVLCIGPVLFQPISNRVFLKLMEKMNISPCQHQDFLEFYNRIPLVPSPKTWQHFLSFFLHQLHGAAFDYRQIKADALGLHFTVYTDYSIPDIPDVALHIIEERYQWEETMISAVSAGNTKEAIQAYYQFCQYKLLPRVADPVRNYKNLMITLNTLLRKAAQAGHVHPLHVDNLSRQIAVQIEATYTMEQLSSLSPIIIRKYCLLVNNYSRRKYSSLIQACMNHIDFHYSGELSLSILANIHAVSASYLSSLFKKETNMTLTSYINETRIRQALILLNTSDLTIGEIAVRCGFPDANYFTRIFKKLQKKTPVSYRKSIGKSK